MIIHLTCRVEGVDSDVDHSEITVVTVRETARLFADYGCVVERFAFCAEPKVAPIGEADVAAFAAGAQGLSSADLEGLG